MGPRERSSRRIDASTPRRPPVPGRQRHAARDAALELERLHARRLRACRSLGLSIPREAAEGPPGSLLRRIAMLDRRIEVSLDLAGGVQFPAWTDDEEEPGDDEPGGAFS